MLCIYPPKTLYLKPSHSIQHNHSFIPCCNGEFYIQNNTAEYLLSPKGWFFLQLNVSSCDLFSGCWVTCCNFPKKMSSDLLLFPFLTAVVSFCQPLFYANFCAFQDNFRLCMLHLWATIIF